MVSTRRKETGKNRAYKAGDKVEVVRPDGIEVGTLLYKMSRNRSTSSPQSVPHWKVSIGDGNVSDDNSSEDVSEHMLGRVLKQSSTVSGGSTIVDTTNSSDTSSPEPLPSAVATGKGKKRGGKQKTVTIVAPPTPPPAAAAKATGGRRRGGRVKAAPKGKRPAAAKYGRKEAPVVAVASVPATTARGKATTAVAKSSPRTGARAGTRSNAANDILTGIDDISRITPAVAGQKKKQLQQSKRKEQRQLRHMAVGEESTSVNKFGETVVKVKLLTGTLFIYKGNADGTAKRRAEFVRSK